MQVIDVSVANKICNGKFYLDNKKLIKVSSYILLPLFVQYAYAYLMDAA